MKRLFILICALFVVANLSAQRIAVLDFNAGAGVSQADVDGISAIFNTYFSPKGYTLVERTRIDRVIDEQNFQRGQLTQGQMVRIGQILNVSKVVIGDVNIIMNQYNVDIRVVNVESGTIAAKDGATWSPGSSYRTMMSQLGSRLANIISITPTTSSVANGSSWKVGDFYDVNGKQGVVFVVTPDRRHGKIICLNNGKRMCWNEAKLWCTNLGGGWRLPTTEELGIIGRVKSSLNSVLVAVGETLINGGYWQSSTMSDLAAWVHMDGGVGIANTSETFYVRAVSAF